MCGVWCDAALCLMVFTLRRAANQRTQEELADACGVMWGPLTCEHVALAGEAVAARVEGALVLLRPGEGRRFVGACVLASRAAATAAALNEAEELAAEVRPIFTFLEEKTVILDTSKFLQAVVYILPSTG